MFKFKLISTALMVAITTAVGLTHNTDAMSNTPTVPVEEIANNPGINISIDTEDRIYPEIDRKELLNVKIKGNFYNKPMTKKVIASLGNDREKQELLHMAYTVWCESKGEGSLGMAYTASVIWNRVNYKGFPDTIIDVVHDPADFSCWGKDGKTQVFTVNREYVAFLQALELSKGLYEGYIESVTTASHYHASTVKPFWVNNLIYLEKCGNHLFYIEEKLAKL
jgi:spore germination cell wall hydrolase CwlJ-like protein